MNTRSRSDTIGWRGSSWCALILLVTLISLAGCASGAEWADVRREFNYRPPPGVNFVLVPRVQSNDLDRALERLSSSLTRELAGRGLTSRPVPYTGPPPLLTLEIIEWDPGNRFARWWGFGGGEAHMLILARFVNSPDGHPALMGRVRAFVRGGTFGGSAMEAPDLAAAGVAQFVASGGVPEE